MRFQESIERNTISVIYLIDRWHVGGRIEKGCACFRGWPNCWARGWPKFWARGGLTALPAIWATSKKRSTCADALRVSPSWVAIKPRALSESSEFCALARAILQASAIFRELARALALPAACAVAVKKSRTRSSVSLSVGARSATLCRASDNIYYVN